MPVLALLEMWLIETTQNSEICSPGAHIKVARTITLVASGHTSKPAVPHIIIPNSKFKSIILPVAFAHSLLITYGFVYCASGTSVICKHLLESFCPHLKL